MNRRPPAHRNGAIPLGRAAPAALCVLVATFSIAGTNCGGVTNSAETTAAGARQPTVRRIAGVFALAGAPQRTHATLVMKVRGATRATLDISESAGGLTLTRYDTDLQRKMHLIVVSDDLESFAHLHPELHPNGHFTLDLHVPAGGAYHLYADAEPTGFGQQVFRFDIVIGGGPAATPKLPATARTVGAGPYAVTLSSLDLNARRQTMLALRITKHGRAAQDLRPYLGALAHAVLISARTLAYVHAHPLPGDASAPKSSTMAMASMGTTPQISARYPVTPHMLLPVTVQSTGPYRLWLQFRGDATVYVARFTLSAR